MASSVWKQNDTWPPIRGLAADENGAVDLTEADIVKFVAKSGAKVIEGSAVAITPPDADGFNWKYTWASEDLATVGTYKVELKVTWDNSSSPKEIQTFPNTGTATLEVVEAQS